MLAENFSNTPYWWRDAPPLVTDANKIPDKTDVLVIGSGYAGLACAKELAAAGKDVIVVDSNDIGSGASTRAAGFVTGRASISKFVKLDDVVGQNRATAILEEADEAYDYFQDFLKINSIDCDFVQNGRFVGAHTPNAFDKLADKIKENRDEGGSLLEMIPRSEQHRYAKSDYFHGGMLIKNAGLVHPAKLHAAMVRLCLQTGVKFFGQTRAIEIVDTPGGKLVRTVRGDIHARDVMVATGGYTDKVSTWHRRRIIPMSSTIIATEHLGTERVRSLLPAGSAVIDTKRVIIFARPSPDGAHILFGGRARFTPVGPEKSVRILHRQMIEIFPDLTETKVINAWSGLMAFTFDFLPKLGVIHGTHYAMACNGGAGIVMMHWLGRKSAQMILGNTDSSSAFCGLPFETRPFYNGTPWFIPIVGTWYRLRDWMELQHAI